MNVYEIVTGESYDSSAGWCVQRSIYKAFGIIVDDERDIIPKEDLPKLARMYNLQFYGPGHVLLRANEPVVAVLIQEDQDTDHAVHATWKEVVEKKLAGVITANPTKYPI